MYNPKHIEEKWLKAWQESPINTDKTRPKFYCLDMFPYPSGDGLHIGHWRNYVISDTISRYNLLKGQYIIHPMGFDAFGLPAENHAIKHEIHPSQAVTEAVTKFTSQLHDIGAMYDWDMTLNTTDPSFYKWTQWIFVKMFKAGLAYEKEMPLNWCSNCKVVLANEEATNGECERCGGPSTKKNLRQWMLSITKYAQRLLTDLDKLDWPEKVKKMQAEWIGRSEGARVVFPIVSHDESIEVFTTRPDTLFGATFMVLAPEHPLVNKLTTSDRAAEVEAYVKRALTLSNVDRMASKDKTGVFIGAYATNPANGEKVEVWVGDYVLIDYGTGAIMCVPGHDDRDNEFAKVYGLPIVEVVTEDGILVNSAGYNGMSSDEAKRAITQDLADKGQGEHVVNYRLRDWVFSRQRYWGEPIPIIHCDACGPVAVPEEDLPVTLPHVDSYKPTDTGESPLSKIDSWVNTLCPNCKKPAKRETNTMPQWAGSSWYFLRYVDVNNDDELISKEAMERFMPVDYYVGGVEHAVLHLLYARFYTKFLYDIDVVSFDEPFIKLFNQGMITKDGKKMSKSLGNTVSPNDIIDKYGRDALRLYILFVGPPELDADWNDSGLEGVYRFLSKLWRLFDEHKSKLVKPTTEHEYIRNKMIQDLTSRLDNLSLNTVVSGLMEYTNKLTELARKSGVDKGSLQDLALLLSPVAPHMAEELWQGLGANGSIFNSQWPSCDESKLVQDNMTIVVQINGKLRANIDVSATLEKDGIIALAKDAVTSRLEGATIVKEIYVTNKLVNFVIKP